MRETKQIVVITCNKCKKEIFDANSAFQGVSWDRNMLECGVGVPTPDGVADFCVDCYLTMLNLHIKRLETIRKKMARH